MTDRTERLEMRLTEAEKELIQRAANFAGIETAVAVRQEALAWARWVLGLEKSDGKKSR